MGLTHPSSVGPHDLVNRIKAILTDPKNAWDRIAAEPATVGGLYMGYVVVLAAIPLLARLVHGVVFGAVVPGVSYHPPILSLLVEAVAGYVLTLGMIYLLALAINAVAGNFGGEKNSIQALKVSVYSFTAAWLSGVFLAAPRLWLLTLLGVLYSIYILYLGLPRLMKAPQDQALGYTAVSVLVGIVLYAAVLVVAGAVSAPFDVMGGGLIQGGGLAHGG